MKRFFLTLTAVVAMCNVNAQAFKEINLELSTLQMLNRKGAVNEIKAAHTSGIYASASLVAFGHFIPDFAGTKADDYGMAMVGYQLNPFSEGPLADLQVDLGLGIFVDGYGEQWYTPSFRSMSAVAQLELRYPIYAAQRINLGAEAGSFFFIGGPNEQKFDFRSGAYLGLSTTWKLTK